MHHERRLHHLLLLEELKSWEQQYLASTTPTLASSPYSTQTGVGATGMGAIGMHGDPAAAVAPVATSGGSFFSPVGAPNSAGPSAPPSGLPSRSPSPAQAGLFSQYGFGGGGSAIASGLQSPEGYGGGSTGPVPPFIPGYTSAGFPQADEGGAACPQAAVLAAAAAAGGSAAVAAAAAEFAIDFGPFTAAAPAGPFDLLPGMGGGGMGCCMSSDIPLAHMLSEPMIDVGLDLPAAVQLKDHISAQLLVRQRSTTGPDMYGLPAALSPPGSVVGVGGSTTPGRTIERSVSSTTLQGQAISGGVVGGSGGMAHASVSSKNMTVTGDEAETGQPVLLPAPTAVVASMGSSGGGETPQDQLAQLRRSEVRIQHSALLNYWLVTIQCRDRNKLFFDTVRGVDGWMGLVFTTNTRDIENRMAGRGDSLLVRQAEGQGDW